MSKEEEVLAKSIQYLNEVLQKDDINSVDLDISKYDDGTNRISVIVDYNPLQEKK